MDILPSRCAGIDIGKRTLTVCVIASAASGEPDKETRIFGTLTRDLLALADWLHEHRVSAVAMDATGSYWKPICNLLGERGRVWSRRAPPELRSSEHPDFR
jgi:transposase